MPYTGTIAIYRNYPVFIQAPWVRLFLPADQQLNCWIPTPKRLPHTLHFDVTYSIVYQFVYWDTEKQGNYYFQIHLTLN